MSSNDFRYFRARAVEERARASAAPSEAIRAVHIEFAARYDQMAGRLQTAGQLESSRNAVQRSLELLRTTDPSAVNW